MLAYLLNLGDAVTSLERVPLEVASREDHDAVAHIDVSD